jgi:ABC-type sugar transport system substrate-binding protein
MHRLSKSALRWLGGGVAIAASAGVVAAAALGGSADGASRQYEYPLKVTICHHTGSTTNPFVTIAVSEHAVPAPPAHGDTLGVCP